MNIIMAYFCVNIKTILKDKISLIWSIVFPAFFLLGNKNNIHSVLDIRYYWGYIIFNSYIFGVGIHSIRQREYGTLKTFFSIKDSRWEFFGANVLTQICFTEITFCIFNLFIFIITKLNFWEMMLLSNIMIILMLPLTFLSFIITLFKKVHVNTLNSVLMIFTTICLFGMGIRTPINALNPLYYASDLLLMDDIAGVGIYVIVSLCSIISGGWCIKNFTVFSNEIR